ncbi:MAG: hypothetical protein EON52_18990, partial [Actinomycetales bacterium]
MRLRLAALVPLVFCLTALGALFSSSQAAETPAPSPAASASAGATSSPPDADYYIAVQLLDSSKKAADGTSGVPVPDVKLTVVDDQKAEVGSSVTDAEGRVYIPIEGGGKYTVELDE